MHELPPNPFCDCEFTLLTLLRYYYNNQHIKPHNNLTYCTVCGGGVVSFITIVNCNMDVELYLEAFILVLTNLATSRVIEDIKA